MAMIAPSIRITLAIDQIAGVRRRRVADQRLVRPVAGVGKTRLARAIGGCRPGTPEEEGGQRLAVGHILQCRRQHGVLFAQRSQRGLVTEQADVVPGHLLHGLGTFGGQRDHAGCGIVGVAAHFFLQARVERGLLADLQAGIAGAVRLLRPYLAQRDGLAVQPVGRPVRRKIGAVPPDRAELLATGGQPGFLAALNAAFGENGLPLDADDLLGDRRCADIDLGAHPAECGEGQDADHCQPGPELARGVHGISFLG
jgi:hypothetical protein